MKLNNYIIDLSKNKDSTMLFNSMNGEIIEIKKGLNSIEQNDIDYLKNNLFLKCTDFDEKKYVNSLENLNKYSSRKVSLVIHTNYSCNLKCKYCYQSMIENPKIINPDVIDEIVNFVYVLYEEKQPEIIELCFIGGEPLLKIESMKSIIENVENLNLDCKIHKNIISNGTLLSKNNIIEIEAMGIDFIQVTLDGPQNIHDKFRCSINGKGSYDLIIDNIENITPLLNGTQITVNVNINKENYLKIENLILDLKKRKIDHPLIFSLVFENEKSKLGYIFSSIELQDIWFKIHKLCIEYGYTFDPLYRTGGVNCGYYLENEFNISPDGMLFKCISGMENEEFEICKMSEYGSGIYNERVSNYIENRNVNLSVCEGRDCKYWLICGGGCVFNKKIQGDFCNKIEFENNDLKLIKYVYEKECNNV